VVLLSGVLEHVPDFEEVIAQVCRVCSAYVILHRCPFTGNGEDEYTAGSQYNIETARIYFVRELVIGEFARRGFSVDRKVRQSILLGQKEAPVRRVATLVFGRR
jgi:hypothetical protein